MTAATLALAVGLVQIAAAAPAPEPIRWAVAVFPSGDEFALEIAADPVARTRGYMYREDVGPRDGMLFIFESQELQSFWMKNCKVPLDLVWIDESFTVVSIVENQPPCPEQGECPTIISMRPARFVLEVAAGIAGQQGLEVGDRIVMHSDPPIAP